MYGVSAFNDDGVREKSESLSEFAKKYTDEKKRELFRFFSLGLFHLCYKIIIILFQKKYINNFFFDDVDKNYDNQTSTSW